MSNGGPGRNGEEVWWWRGKSAEDASARHCLYPSSCLYAGLYFIFFKCVRDRVKCVWETGAELECLLLMGLTLLSAVQPCCVGKRAVVSPCHCQECFPVFVFILVLSALTVPLFFPLHFSHFVCCFQSSSLQTWAPSIKCYLACLRHWGSL